MTTVEIKKLLLKIGFEDRTGDDKLFIKVFTNHNDYELQIQFEAQKILYGDKILLGDETTSNFEKPENFVVLECVNRLLEKGYKPEHLYLEKKWALGRTGKSGKADISVNSQDGKALLIIECKTFGEEYDKEKKRMIENGGQLFSYLQQDRNTKFLCLYASSLFDDNIIYENSIIPIKDSEEQIEAVKNNIEDAKTYSTANTAEELYEVWKENHNLYFHPNGIFDEEIEPYNIELKPLKKKDLKPFKEGDGGYVFNQFLEILRHNNISDKSNAFNKIMSLFLCKIVDEQKNDNEVLEFQVKEGIDTPESIQDRLLKLYTSGMKQYLKEEIINYSEEDIDKIVNNFPIQTSRLRIKEILKELKFYTNNEFAFKEVHNKKLFKENAKVLNEVIRLFQDKKFKYSKKEQYLGTFFELLLNAGYKQDEGQFFTPVPIVKFIINSLPFEKLVKQKLSNKSRAFLPYVMDYACGSGHFLTESIDKIQNIINVLNYDYDEDTNITIKHFKESAEWAAEFIFGIEKDYRLARTSKVACFMNGDGAANVIFGDGLEKHDRLKDKYEIVVANPPYAIKSFKQHLRVKETDYNLISLLTSDASQIEVLFVERTKQLLTPGGVAGIILPDSLLNSEGIYTKAREIILEYFEVISIVSLGSKTFIATGKDTAIFFLKRRNDSFALDRKFIAIDYILKNKKRAHDFIDSEALLKDYVEVIDITIKDYKTFLSRKPNKQIIESEMYQEYWEWFINSSTYNTFITKPSFTKLKAKEQEKQIAKLFFDNILPIEMEKFYFFMLTKEQETLIIKWDSSVKSQKDILGYEFSKRRGFEEVVMIKEELTDNYITKLYNERDLGDKSKINSYILNAFDGKIIDDCDKSLESIINRVQLSDCLDFSHINFEKVISLDVDKQVIESQFPSKRISRLLKPIKGSTEKILESLIKDKGKLPVITQGKEFISGYTDADVSPIDDIPLIVFGDHTTIFKYIDFPFVRGADGLQLLKVDPNEILPKAFYYICQILEIENASKYMRHMKYLKKIKIPIPPIPVQKQLISSVEAIEKKRNSYLKKKGTTIEEVYAKIETEKKKIILEYLK